MPRISKYFSLSLVLFIFIFFSVSSLRLSVAQEDETKESQTCVELVAEYFQQRERAYIDFLQTNFLNEAPSSDVLGNAVTEYRDFSQDLNRKIQEVYKPRGGEVFTGQTEEYVDCVRLMESYREVAKKVLYHQAMRTGQAKKTLQITTRYQSINSKLRDLVNQMAEVQGYFDLLNSKVPCYVRTCQK